MMATENCLEIEDVLKFESLEACKSKKATFALTALKIAKIQIFSFREEKCLSVWNYDKNISTLMYLYLFLYLFLSG